MDSLVPESREIQIEVNQEAFTLVAYSNASVVIVERKGGTLTFRSRFLDFTGVYMMHCHMMNHEVMGMMASVEVYES